jgi:putative peptidoglycan lipid II flippase
VTLTNQSTGDAVLPISANASSEEQQRQIRSRAVRQIVTSLASIAPFYVFVALVVVTREFLVAREFGVSDGLDAFVMAYMLAAFCVTIGAGPFNAAVIPIYIRVKEKRGLKEAQILLSNILVLAISLLSALIAGLVILFPSIIPRLASGFSESKIVLTTRLFKTLAPFVVLSGVSTIFTAVLNAGKRLAFGAVVPSVTPLIAIGVLLVGHKHVGVWGLAVAVVSGALIEVVLLGFALRRTGLRPMPSWSGFDDNLSKVMGQYGTMVVGSLLMSLTIVVDQSMATWLGPGTVSELNYGGKAVSLSISIASMTVGTVVMPYFSQLVVADNWQLLNAALKGYLRVIFVTTLPITVGLVLFSDQIVGIVYQHGMFLPAHTHIVSDIQKAFALQIPFYVAGTVIVRAIAAVGANRILAIGAGINLLVNVGLNWILMRSLGAVGIALSTTLVYVFSCGFSFFMLRRVLARRVGPGGVAHDEQVGQR